jgi:hypothetical protein
MLGEILELEQLAEACADDGCRIFFFVACAKKLTRAG